MTTPVPRRVVDQLEDAARRSRAGEAIAESYRRRPQTTDDDAAAISNAIGMTEAESW